MKKMNALFTLLVSALVLLASCNQPFTPESVGISGDTLALAGEKMQAYIDNGKLAGISTMVMKNGKVVYNEYFGYSDVESQKPVNANTLFRIFSMTKPVTTVAFIKHFVEGKFKYYEKVSTKNTEY